MDKKLKRKNGKKVLAYIGLGMLCLIVILLVYRGYLMITTPKQYMITTENRFDYQKHYECSGYSSAYVLRCLGEEADGVDLYKQFADKNPDGTLAPGYLWENLRRLGYKSHLLAGTVTDLKHAVSKGVPIVVLIKVKPSQKYLHYVPIVGYDETYFYAADSLSYLVNETESEIYNRRIAIDEFKELWENDTFVLDNIYITIRLK